MDITTLIADAERDGVQLKIVHDQLRIGTTAKNEEWLEKLEPFRAEILAHLLGEPTAQKLSTVFVESAELSKSVTVTALPFPVNTLPGAVGEYVAAAAKAIGCAASFIALPVLCSLARAIGNARVIRLKRSWSEPAIIWAAIVGKSGTHKTPALQAAMKFLDRRQAKAIAEQVEKLAEHEQAVAQYQRNLEAWKRSKSDDQPPWKPDEPVCVRYSTSDCTIEALASLLAVQFDGLLVSRDELAGWLAGIAEYKGGKGSDLGHWLAMWSAAPLTVDRKTGAIKMLHVSRAAVNLIGGIQPGVLRRAIVQEHMQDGLCARLLFAMPEARKVTWTEATVQPDVEAAMGQVFDALFALEPAADGDGKPEPFPLDMTPEAKALWVRYFNRHRAELLELDDDLAAAWSKLEAYAARFALIIQLATDPASETVDQLSMSAAIELSDWFGNEAKRVYSLFVEDEGNRERRELVEWIQRRGGRCTARELAHGCRRYRAKGEAESALAVLLKEKLGRWEVVPTATNNRREFVLTTPVTVTHSRESAEISESVTVTTVTAPQHEKNGHDPDAINRLFGEAVEGLE